MKTFWINLIVTCALHFTISSFGQEQPAFEKTYFQEADGKIYWNLKIPVYLNMASTPEMKEAVTLKEVRNEEMKKYALPFYFDGPGEHYIRHLDNDSPIPEHEVAFRVYVDGINPATTTQYSNAPKFVSKGITYYGQGLTIKLLSKDEMSGVKETYHSINGAGFNLYTSDQSFSEEKAVVYKYFSVDRTGNAEATREVGFTVDLTAPKTTHSVAKDFFDNILSPRSRITLTSTDNSSGVKSVAYSFDGNSNVNYYTPLPLYGLADGDHKLVYNGKDNVNNMETIIEFPFYLDKTPPMVTSSFEGESYKTATKVFVASATKITLSATDNKAGVKSIQYILDGRQPVTYDQPFLLGANGNHFLMVRGIDNVQNEGSFKSNDDLNKLYVDNNPPDITYNYDGQKVLARDTNFVTSTTKVKLSAKDYESGVATINYNLDATTSQVYNNPFTADREGLHRVEYSASDNVKNSKTANFFFVIDNTGPEIFYHMSLQNIGTQRLQGKSVEIPVYAAGTSVYLAATDKLVGTKAVYYSLNNLPEVIYGTTFKLLNKGSYTLKIRAVDLLGNETKSDVFEFVVQ